MIRNMVKMSCAAPGTGTTVTLSTAQPGYSSFDGFGNAAAVYYMLTDGTNSELQAGTVTVGSPSTLSRGTPIWNSANSGVRLNFSGTTTVYNVLPAERAMYADASSVWQAQGRRVANVADGATATDAAPLNQVAWRKISTTQFATTTAGVIFTLPAAFRRFRIDYVVVTAVAQAAYMQLSTDGGSTYKAGASDYNYIAASARAASVGNAGGAEAWVRLSDAAYASGVVIHGSVEWDANLNYGTADAFTLITGPVLARWVGGFSPGFAGASNAARVGVLSGSMSSGIVALSGNY